MANMDPREEDINFVKWMEELNDSKVEKKHMNRLVMNFLVTEGYLEAAEKFQLETGIQPQIDIATITERVAVKKAVLNGNTEDAIQKVNDLFPEVLVTHPQIYFHLQQQQFIESIRNGKIEEALEFVRVELAPKAEKDQGLLEELERIVVLLACEDVSNCSASELLDMSERLKTADEVNVAILMTQIQRKDPILTLVLKEVMSLENLLYKIATYGEESGTITLAFFPLTESSKNLKRGDEYVQQL